MSKSTRTNKVLKFAGWCIATFLLALIIVFVLHRSSLDVVHQWQQPTSVTYDDWGPYYLSVVEDDRDWSGFPLYVERNYLIYVGRDSGKPSYGHMVKYSFHAYPDDLKTFLTKAQTNWTDKGVELLLPSGHSLFVPKDMFIGGR
jgi:hypothetical protein